VVDGIEYKKILHDSDKAFFCDTPDFLYGLIREENKKVYMKSFFPEVYEDEPFLKPEVLIYDFGLDVGDVFYENFGDGFWDMNMELVSKEEVNNKKVFTFTTEDKFSYNIDENPMMVWVEGAGGYHALGLEQLLEMTTCALCGDTKFYPTLESCYLGDECLCTFDKNGYLVLGIEEIKANNNSKSDKSVYDLQGRRLSAEPAHGIYIKDGKKVAR